MAISTTNNRVVYTGDGVQTAFSVSFLYFNQTHLKVYVDGVLQSSGYSVSPTTNTPNGSPGGTVTFSVAPANGKQVLIVRDVPLTQGVDYVENNKFPANTHEQALDSLTMITQQLKEELGRSLKIPITSTLTDIDVPVGSSASDRGGKIFRWKSDGSALELAQTSTGSPSFPALTTGAKLFAGASNAVGQGTDVLDVTAFAGADACAKIQAAIDAAYTLGGAVVDARGLTGTQSGAGFTIKQDVEVWLGEIDLTITASIVMHDNSRLFGVRGSIASTFEASPGAFKGGTRITANWTTGTGAARAIIAYGASNTVITQANVQIMDLYLWGDNKALYGIWADRFADLNIQRVWVNACTTDPFHIGDTDVAGEYSFIAHLEDCYGLGASLGSNFKITKANQVRMTRCYCDSNLYSVNITGTNCNVSQCYFESAGTAFVFVGNNSGCNLFQNNTLIGTSVTDYGFNIDNANDTQIIAGNYIFGANVAGSIAILASSSATKVIASNNRINGYPNGIKLSGAGHVAIGNAIKTTTAGTGVIIDGNNQVVVSNEIATSGGISINKLSGTGQVVFGNRVDAAPGSMFHNEVQDDVYIVGGTLRFDNNEAVYWKDSLGNWRRIAVLAGDSVVLGDVDKYGADVFLDAGSTSKTIDLRLGSNPGIRVAEPADTETAMLVRRNVGGTLSLQRVSMGAADSGGAGFKVLRVPN